MRTLSAEERAELWADRDAYAAALNRWLETIRRFAPYEIGEVIDGTDFDDAPAKMVVDKIAVEVHGGLSYSGRLLAKNGTPGTRRTGRRVNLLHEYPRSEPAGGDGGGA